MQKSESTVEQTKEALVSTRAKFKFPVCQTLLIVPGQPFIIFTFVIKLLSFSLVHSITARNYALEDECSHMMLGIGRWVEVIYMQYPGQVVGKKKKEAGFRPPLSSFLQASKGTRKHWGSLSRVNEDHTYPLQTVCLRYCFTGKNQPFSWVHFNQVGKDLGLTSMKCLTWLESLK